MLKKVVFSVVLGVVMHVGSSYAMSPQAKSNKRTIMQAETSDIEPSTGLPQCPGAPRKKARTAHRASPSFPVPYMLQQFSATVNDIADLGDTLDTPVHIHLPHSIPDNDPCKLVAYLVALNKVPEVHTILALFPNLIHEQDVWGDTLLHKAVKFNQAWYVQLLCEKGARVYMANHIGDTPITLAGREAGSIVLPILNRYNQVSRTVSGY
jgi:hypothetical protein